MRFSKYSKLILPVFAALALLASCESETPTEYKPVAYAEGFLLVGEPIEGIRFTMSQPVQESYDVDKAKIKNGDVRLRYEGKEIILQYRDEEPWGYFYPDTSEKVKPATEYELFIAHGGEEITAKTFTPTPFDWIDPPLDVAQFPADSVNQPPPGSISWTQSGLPFYIISVKALDTLEYGKYLEPPRDEKNRRIFNALFGEDDDYYNDVNTYNLISNTQTPVVWFSFKWFGLNEVTVYSPDYNYLQWFLKYAGFDQSNEYNPNLANINGEKIIGVFGSASFIRKQMLVLKNQP